jgi:hypothetical protein
MSEFIYRKISSMGKLKIIIIPKDESDFNDGDYVRIEKAK